jgi:hypothetical protein
MELLASIQEWTALTLVIIMAVSQKSLVYIRAAHHTNSMLVAVFLLCFEESEFSWFRPDRRVAMSLGQAFPVYVSARYCEPSDEWWINYDVYYV